MSRHILDTSHIHPAIRENVNSYQNQIIIEVQTAIAAHHVTVVGMAQNPFCKKARQALSAAGIANHYLEYGSYLSKWNERGALKMWTGWPTFPMVFVDGILIGGYTDLKRLLDSGALHN
jgi:glutaredoxin-related protein